jgi:hypothetical protein
MRPSHPQHIEKEGDDEQKVGVGKIDERTQLLDRATMHGVRERKHSFGSAEPDGRPLYHPPASSADFNCLPGVVAKIQIDLFIHFGDTKLHVAPLGV